MGSLVPRIAVLEGEPLAGRGRRLFGSPHDDDSARRGDEHAHHERAEQSARTCAYVIEHSTGPQFFVLPGDLVKITPDGQRTVLVSNLNRPTSVLVTGGGTVYYTNKGITAGAGEVWKWTP